MATVQELYHFINETYILRDSLETYGTEVGDSKQPDIFYPQVKMMKWDNEANLSMRLDYPIDGASLHIVQDTIVWTSADGAVDVLFYSKEPSGNLYEFGGYEMEVILNVKPSSNRIPFTIKNKNFKWVFQPPLTEAQIAQGDIRPDNVVNSYAVYHINKRNNKYKTGKAFHLYRPQAYDKDGTTVYGEIELDLENEKLYVVLPQDFIDNATYPIYHATGTDWGNAGVGGSSTSTNAAGSIRGYSENNENPAGEAIEQLNSMSFYGNYVTAAVNVKGAIYQHAGYWSGTMTGTLTAATAGVSVSSTTAQWWTANFAKPYSYSVPDASYYYITGTIAQTVSRWQFFYDAGLSLYSIYRSSNYTTPTASLSFADDTTLNYYSIYVTSTAPAAKLVNAGTDVSNTGII